MIDVHCHVLPGIDDGTKENDEAIAFCRRASEAGTEILVATPHHKPGSYSNPRDRILERVEDLQRRCDAAGVRIRIAPGCEIFSDIGLPEKIASGEVLTYGDARRHILLEFSFQQYPVNVDDMIFRLRLSGITPVIAHPERIRWFQEDRDRLEQLVGAEEARKMVSDHPAALLEAREIRAPQPVEDEAKARGGGLRGLLGKLGVGRRS